MSGIKRASWYEYRIGVLKSRTDKENEKIIGKLERKIRGMK